MIIVFILQEFLDAVDQRETWFTNKEVLLSSREVGVRTSIVQMKRR